MVDYGVMAASRKKKETKPRYVRLTDKDWDGVCAIAEREERTGASVIQRAVRLFLAGGAVALATAEAAHVEPTDEALAGAWVRTLEEPDQIRLYWIGEALREKRSAPRGLWFDGNKKR